MSHCPANPRFGSIHEERATGSHYVCALCGARRLRAWAPSGANMEIMGPMQDDILRAAKWDGGYPKAVPLFGGGLCFVHSAAHEAAVRRANRRVLLCFVALAAMLGIFLFYLS